MIDGLRDKIKPGWEGSLKKESYEKIPSNDNILVQLDHSKSQINKLERLMSIHSIEITNKMDILEIGAANGVATYQIASKEPQSIVGSDIVQYQINQTVTKKKELETIWKTIQPKYKFKCAHLKLGDSYQGCILDYLPDTRCPH